MAKVEKHRQSPTSKDLVIISVPSFFNTTHTHTNISWSSWWSCLLNSPGNLKKSEEKNIPNLLPSHHSTQQHLHPGTLPSLLSWAWTVGVLCKANPSTCPPGRFLSLFKVITPAILSVQIFFQFTPPDAFSTSPILLFDSLTWIKRLPCPLAPDCFGQWKEPGYPGKD